MTYEVIHEIFNSCSGNQMRDIFFDEKDFENVEDLEKYVRAKHDGKVGDMERTDHRCRTDSAVQGLCVISLFWHGWR